MNENVIQFFTEDIDYQIKGKRVLRRGIVRMVVSKGFRLGPVNIVLCSDEYLKGYNRRYLNHNY